MGEEIHLRLDGEPVVLAAEPWETLAGVLRRDADAQGVRVSCDQGVCGSCSVLTGGRLVASCSTFAYRHDGEEVVTGQAPDAADPTGVLAAVRRAFLQKFAFQCGYCTPGMVVAAFALLREDPAPARDRIVSWMSSNICRCTGYEVILEAVELASVMIQEGASGGSERD